MEKFIISSLKILFWIIFGSIIKAITTKLKIPIFNYLTKYLINLIIFGLVPYFVAINIWKYGLNKEVILIVVTVYLSVMFIAYLITQFITKIKNYNLSFQEVFFPLAFMNTLYLGIPVTQYFVSLDATYYAIIYSIVVSIIQFSFGIYILNKKFVVELINFLLIICVFIIAFILNYLRIEIPKFLFKAHNLISTFLSPLMLCLIGYSTKWSNLIENIRLHVFTNLTKIMITFLFVTIFLCVVNLFISLDHKFIKSTVLISILPSAILNYIILERLNIRSNFTLGEIFWGTIITLFLLPYLSEIIDIVLLIIK